MRSCARLRRSLPTAAADIEDDVTCVEVGALQHAVSERCELPVVASASVTQCCDGHPKRCDTTRGVAHLPYAALTPGSEAGWNVVLERWMAKHCLTLGELDRDRIADIDRNST